MYSIKGDGIVIYSDVSPTESRKAASPKLTIGDNSAGSLEITLPSGNAGYDILERRTSEIVVYRDNVEVWSGRIISEKLDFWKNRVLTCEGELAYLNDTIQPQHKYFDDEHEEGITVGKFLEAVLDEHNKRFDNERYKFHIGETRIYNYDEILPEIVTDYETTLDCINKNIIERFQCHIRIEKINGKKYIGFVKEDAELSENTQTIRFGTNLLDFTKNWDLSELATVLIPRGMQLETEADENSDAFNKYVTLSDIPYEDMLEESEWGHYLRDKAGNLEHDENNNLIYVYDIEHDEEGNPVYKYKKDNNGYIPLETVDGKVTIRVDTNQNEFTEDNKIKKIVVEFLDYSENQNGVVVSKIETDGAYAVVYLSNEQGELYCLKDIYGHSEQVVDFSDAVDSIELIKNVRDYIQEQQFDKMVLEISAVDLRYLSEYAEPVKILDRMRCISYPHGMNTLFTVMELSIELDKPESAKYTLQKTVSFTPKQTSLLSGAISSVTAELQSPQSSVLLQARSDADKILREKTNGYVTYVTDTEGGRHSEALVVSSGRDYKHSDHFWIWNANGLGHYTKYVDDDGHETENPDPPEKDDVIGNWLNKYSLNVGMTMDGQIVANRITVGHMSADRVRTGVLVSQDGNVIWNLNYKGCDVTYDKRYEDEKGKEYYVTKTEYCEGGSLMIRNGSISLGTTSSKASDRFWDSAFYVDDSGNLHAEKGNIGGFTITASDIHNDKMTLDGWGLHLKDTISGVLTNVGYIGTSEWKEDSDLKNLAIRLEPDASAIVWAAKENKTSDTYKALLVYSTKTHDIYKKDTLTIHGNTDLSGFNLVNAWIDSDTVGVINGIIGDCILLSSGSIKSDGTIDTSMVRRVMIKKGFIVSYS